MRSTAHILAIGCALTVAAPQAMAQDEEESGGRLVRLLENTLSGDGRTIQVVGLDGALSSRATIERITVSDDQGVWFTLEDAVLDWNRLALVRGRFSVNTLSAGKIILVRPPGPSSAPVEPAAPEAKPFALPELPVAIQIGEISVGEIDIGEAVVGTAAKLTLDGAVSLADGALDANLDLKRLDRAGDEITLNTAYSNETRELTLKLAANEASGGLIGSALKLPDNPAINLSLDGSGPLENFAAALALETDNALRFGGDVTLKGLTPEENADGDGEQPPLRFEANLGGDVRELLPEDFHAFFGSDTRIQTIGQRDPDGRLEIETLRVNSEALTLDGALQISADGEIVEAVLQTSIRPGEGDVVILPVAGADTTLERLDLNALFDAEQGHDWLVDGLLKGLTTPELSVAQMSLKGSGQAAFEDGEDKVTGTVDAQIGGLSFTDPALQSAAGDALALSSDFQLKDAGHLLLNGLTFTGAGLEADIDAKIDGLDSGIRAEASGLLTVADISRFSELAGQALEGAISTQFEGHFVPLSGAFSATLDADADDLAIGVAQVDPLIAGHTDLALDAARDEDGVTLRKLTVNGTAITADAQGALRSGAADLQFEAALTDLAPAVPELPGPARLAGQVTQDGAVYSGNVTLTAPKGVNLDAEGKYGAGQTNVTVSGGLEDLGVFVAQLPGAAQLSADVKEVDGAYVGQVNLSAAQGAQLTADGTYVAGGTKLTLTGGLDDLGVFVPQLAGPVTITGDVNEGDAGQYLGKINVAASQGVTVGLDGQYAPGAIEAKLNGALEDLGIFVPQLAGPATLTGNVRQVDDAYVGRVDVVATPGVTVGLDGRYAADAIEATINGAMEDLATFVPQLAGPATVTGEVTGDGVDFKGLVNVTATPGLNLDADGTFGPSGTQATFAGGLDDLGVFVPQLAGPAKLNGAVKDVDGAYEGQVAVDASAGARIAADGSYETGATKATFNAVLDDLAVFVAQLPGPLRVTGTVAEDADGAYAGQVDLTASKGVRLAADGRYVKGGTELTLDGGLDDLGVFVPKMPGPATLSGQVQEIENAYQAKMRVGAADGSQANVDGVYGDDQKNVRFDALLTDLAAFVAQMPGNVRVSGQAQEDDGAYRGDVTVDGSAGLALTADGVYAADASSDLSFDLNVARIERLIADFPGAFSAKGSAKSADDLWTISADATGPAGVLANVAGTYSQTTGQADISGKGQAQLAAANAFISPMAIEGPIQFDLRMNGEPGLPALTGAISLPGARVSLPQVFALIEPLSGQIQLNNGAAQIALDGTWDDGGSFRVSGPLELSAPYNAGIEVALNQLIVTDDSLYRTNLSGQIRASGPLTGNANIGGVINVGATELNIAAPTGGGGPPIPEIRHVGEGGASLRTRERAGLVVDPADEAQSENGGGPAYNLDVTISAPKQVFVRGRGLDAELGGGLSIRGTTANMVPEGEINLIRGRLDLVGKRLDLTRGLVSLQGDFNPFFEFVAENTSSAGTATLKFFGTLDAPEVEVTSSPERPPEEALGLLVFGDQFNNLSPIKLAQLASSLATLTGKTGAGGGILGGARDELGVSSLDLTTDEDGNAQVGVGTYLTDNIYSDVAVNTEGRTQLNLNLDVMDNVTAKGKVDNEGNSSIGLFYSRDF